MSDIVWEDPPPTSVKRAPGKVDWFVAQVQQNPGKWAIYRSGVRYHDATRQQDLKRRGCEAVNRKLSDGTHTLFARWPEDAS